MKNINLNKCIGCFKGINSFIVEDDKLNHFDLFATSEAGEYYECLNGEQIKEYLTTHNNGISTIEENELKSKFMEQAMWWDDIIELAHIIFSNQNKVNDFFNKGEKGNRTWNLSNEEIEKRIISLANEKEIEFTEEDYPDLYYWKEKN